MSKSSHTFEENMQKLEQIVRAMEHGDIALDELLKLFREGTNLVEKCSKMLDEAEQKVTLLVKGEVPGEVDFNSEDAE